MSGSRAQRLAARRAQRRRAARRGAMVAAASVMVVAGIVAGALSAFEDGSGSDQARRPEVSASPRPAPPPAEPPASPTAAAESAPPSSSPAVRRTQSPTPPRAGGKKQARTTTVTGRLYRHPDS